jgi:hypothetical protein
MSINHRNFELKAWKAGEAAARKSQRISGFTVCKPSGDRSEFDTIAQAVKYLGAERGRVIRNSDCVKVYQQ